VGRHGPAREPNAAKLARGETRPSRLNGTEPLPRHSAPVMPSDMDDGAKAVWKHVMAEMRGSGIIAGADRDILRAYCEVVSSYQRHVSLLAQTGPLVKGARGKDLVRSPMHQIVRDDRDQMRLLARELGLSPAARANLSMQTGADLPDIDALLGPPRLAVVGDAG
jgi:P27 family predicted phage terminase small subunit